MPFFAHYPIYSAVSVGEIFWGHIGCICNISGGLQRGLARRWMITVYGCVKMCRRPLVRTESGCFLSICIGAVIAGRPMRPFCSWSKWGYEFRCHHKCHNFVFLFFFSAVLGRVASHSFHNAQTILPLPESNPSACPLQPKRRPSVSPWPPYRPPKPSPAQPSLPSTSPSSQGLAEDLCSDEKGESIPPSFAAVASYHAQDTRRLSGVAPWGEV